MDLGNFSLSLTVKDIARSRAFYEKLGFTVFAGDQSQGWLIMKNPRCAIGLFQGMIDKNMLTFNPGWDADAQPIDGAEDIRTLQKRLKDRGITFTTEVDESKSGPGTCIIIDPDGNPILLDQHV